MVKIVAVDLSYGVTMLGIDQVLWFTIQKFLKLRLFIPCIECLRTSLPTCRLVGAVRDKRRPDKTVHFLFALQLIQLLSRFLDNLQAFNLLNDISGLAHLRITSV